MLRNSKLCAAPLLRILTQHRREFKVALPSAKEHGDALTPTSVARRIHKETNSFVRRAEHLQRLPFRRALHRRLLDAAEDLCDFLLVQLANHRQITSAAVVGASAHSLSLMQDTLWNTAWIPHYYDALVAHVWQEAESYASQMTATDVGSMMYAFYAFRDVLSTIQSSSEAAASNGTGGNERHIPLVRQLVERFDQDIEMGTSQDALSTLMGMAVVPYLHPTITQKIIKHHILPQIPIADHEVLGHIAWATGHLNPPKAFEIMDPLVKRFVGLRSVEYETMSIETFANLLSGLAGIQHPQGRSLSSLLIRYIDRPQTQEWRPRTIVRLVSGVAQFDAHTPSFVGKILRETIKSGRFFSPPEVQQFKDAIDEMNVEPVDQIWESLAQAHPSSV